MFVIGATEFYLYYYVQTLFKLKEKYHKDSGLLCDRILWLPNTGGISRKRI